MESDPKPRYWWLEIAFAFAAISGAGGLILATTFGHYWGGSLLPYVTFPIQFLVSLVAFSLLFAARCYTRQLIITILSVLFLSFLASIAMFICGSIRFGGYHGP